MWHTDVPLIPEKQPEPKRKTADRPHWITILIGIFSPALAIAALSISFRSLRMSELSMQTSQRAYVSISNGMLEYNALNVSTTAPHSLFMQLNAQFYNGGATPATFNAVHLKLKLLRDWSVDPDAELFADPYSNKVIIYRLSKPPDEVEVDKRFIPPVLNTKGEIAWTLPIVLLLSDEAHKNYLSSKKLPDYRKYGYLFQIML